MLKRSKIFSRRHILLGLSLVSFSASPLWADEKQGMPDLSQIEQTCLPTSTANLIVWFGKHGYPNLIEKGDTRDNGYLHTVHRIMTDTDARFDWGTRMDTVGIGINKYIRDAGYTSDVEYRGLEGRKPFTQDWLQENDDPNKGFILLLAYIRAQYNSGNVLFSPVLNVGHAVTLVNAEPDMILIHDPAHQDDETGRKIVTPQAIPQGTLQQMGSSRSVSGLLILSGSLLGAPPNSEVMLTGAVCVTMHPPGDTKAPSATPPSSSPNALVAGGNASGTPSSSPSAPSSASPGWWEWLFDVIFKK